MSSPDRMPTQAWAWHPSNSTPGLMHRDGVPDLLGRPLLVLVVAVLMLWLGVLGRGLGVVVLVVRGLFPLGHVPGDAVLDAGSMEPHLLQPLLHVAHVPGAVEDAQVLLA